MKTFFCRHSSDLDIDDETFNILWKDNLMAIHYPESLEGWNDLYDCDSLNPNDYPKSAKSALNTLLKISKEGGYVFATYENQKDYKIGYVKPDTDITLVHGKWGDKYDYKDRVAKLKCLKFSKSMILNPVEALSLTCAQPRQGTICQWHKVGNRVSNIFNNVNENIKLSDLTPDLQEVLCSEFLRSGRDSSLPTLSSLLMPVGRTMKDVDILGLSENKRILIQVTYDHEPKWKIERLLKYSDQPDVELLLFCKTNNPRIERGVRIYSLDEAFDKFTTTKEGGIWLSKIR